ncbi:GNAT family N-acetyltransferase [Anaerofustis stercorihominis]|uniref:GNAT family N-acetyltransferase n=1 Tax=Anaerofustis stercorihominis TaxID=214853 RepID=UPI00214BE9D6|nr:GNAT family N-acetyltransferase [Anaerofustis stercorihominis]MCR2033594.1 GNAT family N-acetyltransferase [Anaerofustis stercorihominis]
MNKLDFRFAKEKDTKLILSFIKELAVYENMLDDVVADEATLNKWLFEKKKAEVIIGEVNNEPIGFALFFHNFSTFLGKSGIYLEDLHIREEYRKKGYGKKFLKKLAGIAKERDCGRLEWSCLDWNKHSIDFYLSLGAEPMDEWTVYRLTRDKIDILAE